MGSPRAMTVQCAMVCRRQRGFGPKNKEIAGKRRVFDSASPSFLITQRAFLPLHDKLGLWRLKDLGYLSLADSLHQSSVLSPNATRESLTGSEVHQEAKSDNKGIRAMHDTQPALRYEEGHSLSSPSLVRECWATSVLSNSGRERDEATVLKEGSPITHP